MSVERCSSCGEALLTRDAALSLREEDEDLVWEVPDAVVERFASPSDAEWARSALEAAGIPCRVDAPVPQLALSSAALGARVLVRGSDVEAAREVLDSPAEMDDDLPGGKAEVEDFERDRLRFSNARRVRYLRHGLLVGSLWLLLWAVLCWSAGLLLDGGINAAGAIAFGLLWLCSFRAPAGAFAGGAILGTVLLLLVVLGSINGPGVREALPSVLGVAFFVVTMYWGWQSASSWSAKGTKDD